MLNVMIYKSSKKIIRCMHYGLLCTIQFLEIKVHKLTLSKKVFAMIDFIESKCLFFKKKKIDTS